jgi:membrane associated rhomboid family serine protease
MVFFPLKDDNPLRFIPFQFATVLLIAINVAVFVWQASLPEAELVSVAMSGGLVPSVFLGGAQLPAEFMSLPAEVTLLTYMFLHGDWLHLLGNIWFLWLFGDNVEDAMGSVRFVFFYLFCGVLAGVAHAVAHPISEGPLIGASGAIGGVVGAYLILYPRVKMWVLAFARIPLKIPALLMLGSWLAFQFYSVSMQTDSNTAWWAHIGGFAAGLVLIFIFKRPEQKLFAGAPSR